MPKKTDQTGSGNFNYDTNDSAQEDSLQKGLEKVQDVEEKRRRISSKRDRYCKKN